MASTADLCKTITTLGGNPEALSDKRTKTLSDEIIRLLSTYGQTTIRATLDSLTSRVPTSAEVVSAINSMTDEQVSTVKTKFGIQ